MSGRKGVRPGTIAHSIINLLRRDRLVPKERILDEIYGLAPDAPDDERMALNRTISNLRKKGVDIECVVAFRLKP